MDISLNEDQLFLHETARDFAREAMTPARIRSLEGSEQGYDPAVWQQMVDMGWAGAFFPEEYGGAAIGKTELGLIIEALGQGAVPSPMFSTVIEAGMLLLDAGSRAQRETWLPRIASGSTLLTTAITEETGGLKPQEIKTRLVRSGNGFFIQGTKLFVRDAGTSEAMIVAAAGDKPDDITLVMVQCDNPRLSMQLMHVAGGEALWQVTFDNVAVDADAIVGEVGGGWPHVERLQVRGAAFKAAELVGIGQASLDLTISYAQMRQQFGGPIGRFQAVHHHCAEMYRDLEICRMLSWQAAAALNDGGDGAREASIAKAKCSEAIMALTRVAHQIHGAIGYYRDYPLELFYHRAIAAQAAYGEAGHHRRLLSELLLKDPDTFRGDDRHDLPVHYF